ncbi:hypothetical protein BRARA_H01508 [Brassica rapa]|uniref:Protein yippee-like n=1 Tax=Brassica campestris TaxID=3711 RepID=A0A397YBG8_BRACM|nr:hypothetical protein BRARA_H01508 [Brassica rapa]
MGESKTLPKYFYLISKKFVAMNVVVGPKIGRKLLTGSYVVEDVMCSKCGEKLGWKYVETFNLKQRYKEGMFVIEKLKLTKKY